MLLWASRKSNCLPRISLIDLSLFHVVLVLLAEPSDVYAGSASVLNVKGCLTGCSEGVEWVDTGLPARLSLEPRESGSDDK